MKGVYKKLLILFGIVIAVVGVYFLVQFIKKRQIENLPDDIILGKYDIHVYLDGQEILLSDALEVVDGKNRTTVTFGAYNFVASNVSYDNSQIVLSGNVVMNDFLHFKGDVVLKGDMESLAVTLVDSSGSYINFTESLRGLMKVVCSNTMNVPQLGEITLYNDQNNINNLNEYRVDKRTILTLNYAGIGYSNPSFSLYPHKIDISFGEINLDLPFQKEIFKYNGVSPFTAKGSSNAVITSSNIAAIGDFSAELGDNLFLSVVPICLDECQIKFDTLNQDYFLKLAIGTKKIFKIQNNDEDTAYGFSIGFKAGSWDELKLYADIPINLCATPPVSISDFMVGVEGLAGEKQDMSMGDRLKNATYKGSLDVSICKLSDMIPALEAIFADVSILTLDDTTVSLTFSDFMISVSTTAKLFGYIDVGRCDLAVGNFEYENYLLGISKTKTSGLKFEAGSGLNLDLQNLKFSCEDSATVTVSDSFTGIWSRGEVSYEVSIFFVNESGTSNANLLMGLHNNATQFSIIIKNEDYVTNNESGFKITFGGASLFSGSFY